MILGIYFVNGLDRQDPMRRILINWHESIGVTVLILSLLRLGWRLVNPVPRLPADFSPAKRILARGTHYALYALMILVPFIGWELASIPSRPLVLFGNVPWPKIWYLANLAPADQRHWAGIIAPSHVILAFLLFALAIAHLCAGPVLPLYDPQGSNPAAHGSGDERQRSRHHRHRPRLKKS